MLLKTKKNIYNATITLIASNYGRMAPCAISMHALNTTLLAGDYHLSRFRWNVIGPSGWIPASCKDKRIGLQYNQKISLDKDCEGFNFAFFTDVAGSYTVTLNVTDVAGNEYIAQETITVTANTRTSLYVSGNGNDTTGDGSIGNPWRQPSKAFDYINSNGKENFNILIERNFTYQGSISVSQHIAFHNIYIGPYGAGAKPILQLSAAYDEAALIEIVNWESTFIENLHFKGNTADAIFAPGIIVEQYSKNIGFYNLDFGSENDVDPLSYCFLLQNLDDEDTLTYQNVGISFFNCIGHSTAYFIFCGGPAIYGTVSSASFTPTTTEFEVTRNGRLSLTNDKYNNMEVMLRNGKDRNKRYTIQDYIGDVGGGRCKFILNSPLYDAPPDGTEAHLATYEERGSTDIFLFGCHAWATENLGTEVRARFINALRVSAVGSVMDGRVNVPQPKSGWRLMVNYCYLYRCCEINGAIQIGVDIGADGILPHLYNVIDRCYMQARNALSSTTCGFNFEGAGKSVVKSCVGIGCMQSGAGGGVTSFSTQPNTSFNDIRILHSTFLHRSRAEGIPIEQGGSIPAGYTWVLANIISFENNIVVRGEVSYHDWLYDVLVKYIGTSGAAWHSVKNNVYSPDQAPHVNFSDGQTQYGISGWNELSFVDNEKYGTIPIDNLIANYFIPNESQYVIETTNKAFVSSGVFQDYYGNNIESDTYVGAVCRAFN